MHACRHTAGAVLGVASAVVAVTGCATTIGGTPVANTTGSSAVRQAPAPTTTAPAGEPVGTAVIRVSGGSAPVTIRYRINEGPQQTEANVTLPWEKRYTVYDKVTSEVTADGGDTELICTITFNGDKLVSFVNGPRPSCNFAYWG